MILNVILNVTNSTGSSYPAASTPVRQAPSHSVIRAVSEFLWEINMYVRMLAKFHFCSLQLTAAERNDGTTRSVTVQIMSKYFVLACVPINVGFQHLSDVLILTKASLPRLSNGGVRFCIILLVIAKGFQSPAQFSEPMISTLIFPIFNWSLPLAFLCFSRSY